MPSDVVTERPRTSRTTSPGREGVFSTRSSTSRPTINRASSAAFVSRVFRCSDDPAIAHDRHFVGNRQHLVEFVRDDDDGFSLFAHDSQDVEELFDFMRGQHGGRLVEDQNSCLTVEGLQQFHALLFADGEILDRGARIDGQVKLFRQSADSLFRAAQIESLQRCRAPRRE